MVIAPVITADVIYYYQGTINVYTTSAGLIIEVGPNYYVPLPSGTGYYIYVTTTSTSFTANINITNASLAYFYQAVTLTVSKTSNIYFSNITYNGNANYINNMWLVITNTSYNKQIQIISNGKAVQPTTALTLSPGTYYIGIVVQPNTPLPPPSANSIATITVYISDNVISSTAVPLPPGI
ncbi:MAG: hypothetical protein QXR34_08315 [Saccharolobus sp.]